MTKEVLDLFCSNVWADQAQVVRGLHHRRERGPVVPLPIVPDVAHPARSLSMSIYERSQRLADPTTSRSADRFRPPPLRGHCPSPIVEHRSVQVRHPKPQLPVQTGCRLLECLVELPHAASPQERRALEPPQHQHVECGRLQPVDLLPESTDGQRTGTTEELLQLTTVHVDRTAGPEINYASPCSRLRAARQGRRVTATCRVPLQHAARRERRGS